MKRVFYCALVILSVTSCKKNQAGGNSEISGTVAHHQAVIQNPIVYIKFNAKEFPGTDSSMYDTKVTGDVNGFYKFGCYKGDYYLYATGVDLSGPKPLYVNGGVPARVRSRENVKADIAVAEKH